MKGFRTILFNVLGLILVMVQYFLDTPGFLQIDPTILTTIIVAGNFILRFISDTPVFGKSADATRAGPGSRK